jgi:Fe-S oxidoreductase
MLAMQNIETLDGMGVKKIITQCPHCFNTIWRTSTRSSAATTRSIHHTELLECLIDTGRST